MPDAKHSLAQQVLLVPRVGPFGASRWPAAARSVALLSAAQSQRLYAKVTSEFAAAFLCVTSSPPLCPLRFWQSLSQGHVGLGTTAEEGASPPPALCSHQCTVVVAAAIGALIYKKESILHSFFSSFFLFIGLCYSRLRRGCALNGFLLLFLVLLLAQSLLKLLRSPLPYRYL